MRSLLDECPAITDGVQQMNGERVVRFRPAPQVITDPKLPHGLCNLCCIKQRLDLSVEALCSNLPGASSPPAGALKAAGRTEACPYQKHPTFHAPASTSRMDGRRSGRHSHVTLIAGYWR